MLDPFECRCEKATEPQMSHKPRDSWWHRSGWHMTMMGAWYRGLRNNIEQDVMRYEGMLQGARSDEDRKSLVDEISMCRRRLTRADAVSEHEIAFELCPSHWATKGLKVKFCPDEKEAEKRHQVHDEKEESRREKNPDDFDWRKDR